MADVNEKSKKINAPKITFPCSYPIKIIGISSLDFDQKVLAIIKKHAPEHDGSANYRNSNKGNYRAINVIINATGEPQLQAIFEELKTLLEIKLVL